jgi:hypothetical protein
MNEPLAKRKGLSDFSPLFGCDAINFFVPNVLKKIIPRNSTNC